jgi:hypothetical protein
MPTGYTADVGEGKITTLRDFALRCARGMGACISMRDDPWDKQIPEKFEPYLEYSVPRLEEAKALLAELDTMSLEEAGIRAEIEFNGRLASYTKYRSERDLENERYRTMLDAVESWRTEAEGIKEFMIQQLSISISDYQSEPPIKLTGEEWLRETRLGALHDIAYHEKQIAEEIHRTEMRNLWLAALRRSFPIDGGDA